MERVISSIATPNSRSSGSPLGRLLSLLEVSRSRQRLENLDDHLLRDIGLTREKALLEARRPLWDAPDHWLR